MRCKPRPRSLRAQIPTIRPKIYVMATAIAHTPHSHFVRAPDSPPYSRAAPILPQSQMILAAVSTLSLSVAFTPAAHVRAPRLAVRASPLVMEEEAAEAPAAPPPPPPPKVEYSESMPFLVKRPQLSGYVGDVGFDPVGFSEILPMDWLREAELKHCRVCMLATVGFAFTDFYTLPGFEYTTLEAHDACVASGAMSQLLLWIGALEVVSAIKIDQMLRGSGSAPGDYGFDPLGFASDPKKLEELQMKELANGRLAMFAFGGFVTQSVLTGSTFPYMYDDTMNLVTGTGLTLG